MNNEILCYENEVWKDIPNYEGLYEASSFGRIRTKEGKITYTKMHGARHWKSRIMRGRGNNYITGKRVGLWKDGIVKDWLVARLVAITFLGKPTKNANTVNHINGNRLDNRIENLEWLSIADNLRHAFNNGLMPNHNINLFNENCNKIFRSMSEASKFLGRNHGYISLCLSKNRKIRNINNELFNIKIL